jgi:hypothetical protein
MSEVYYKLDEILHELEVTAYFLSQEAKLRPNTVYNIQKNTSTSINNNHIASLLSAANRISREKKLHRKFDISDILEYKD